MASGWTVCDPNKSNEPDKPTSSEPEELEYAGLDAIDRACHQIYPDQPNPLQATAVVKMWLGGPDPLDYISIFSNPGEPGRGIPPHWHYVSYGFSDLYGDGRAHQFEGAGNMSGFGFELTLRLKRQEDESSPPMWPSGLMNRLANYVFQTGNVFHIGDHVPWHKPLDGHEDSCIQHMLVTQDPKLSPLNTPHGILDFRQLVGVTDDEMKAAQKWKGAGVLELMAETREIGPFYITDTTRSQSIFETDSELMSHVNEGINNDGSNLGHVTALCMWVDINARLSCIKETSDDFGDSIEPECLEGVHLMFDAEAANLLPMVVRARLQKGRFFVFHNAENHTIHMIPPDFQEDGVYVSQTEPLKAQASYLQIFCSHNLLERMAAVFSCLQNVHDEEQESQHYPKEFKFSDPSILITVSPRGQLLGTQSFDL